jgi:hypothetical protein
VRGWIIGYYALTPLFWLADGVYGANLRAVALQDAEGWRTLYYLICTLSGAALWLRPAWTDALALFESSLNLLLLVLGVLLPYWRLADQISSGQAVIATPYTPELVVNFMIAGSVALAAFYLRLHSGYDRAPHGGSQP